MTSKMSTLRDESIVGYTKVVTNYTVFYDSEEEDDLEEFYEHYESYEDDFDDGDYQPFDPEEEEKEHQAHLSPKLTKTVKPLVWINSPTKNDEKSPIEQQSPTWWDKNETVEKSKRIVNGVLNYAALLPPPSPKKIVEVETPQPKTKSRKNKKNKAVKQAAQAELLEQNKKIKSNNVVQNNLSTSISKITFFKVGVIMSKSAPSSMKTFRFFDHRQAETSRFLDLGSCGWFLNYIVRFNFFILFQEFSLSGLFDRLIFFIFS